MGFKERVKGGSWEFIFHQTKTYKWEKILVILPHAFSSLNFLGADFLASKAVTSVKIHLFWGLLCRRNSRFPLSIFWIKTLSCCFTMYIQFLISSFSVADFLVPKNSYLRQNPPALIWWGKSRFPSNIKLQILHIVKFQNV